MAMTRNTMTYIGGASRSSISKFQARASAVNAAMPAAKTGGTVVGRTLVSPSHARAAETRAIAFGIADIVVMGR